MPDDGDKNGGDDKKVTKFPDKKTRQKRAMKGELDKAAKGDGVGKKKGGNRPAIREIPPNCPVVPLGVQGHTNFFLDAHGQLRAIRAKDLNRSVILNLFGSRTDWLYELWPVWKMSGDDDFKVTGWNGTQAQESLSTACARAGLWRPEECVRGRGGWRLPDGRLVFHAGRSLHLSSGEVGAPGVVGQDVYPAAAAILMPGEDSDTLRIRGKDAAQELRRLISTWQWKRIFDADLLMGWICSAFLAGALKVRPLVWVTGEKDSGKSSLIGDGGLIHKVLGPMILVTANTSPAGLYQRLGHDALPVAIDELEARGRNNFTAEMVIELARQSYSGAVILRGGADHVGQEFRARAPFLFGSILIPPLPAQDLSRMALLNLDKFPTTSRAPVMEDDRLVAIGRALLRRMVTHWHEWPQRLAAFHNHLQEMGHSGRAADQFGTLLAACDLALHDGAPAMDRIEDFCIGLEPMSLSETDQNDPNSTRCISYAMSRPLQGMRGGETLTVAELVTCAVRRFGGEMENPIQSLDAVRYLERAGLSVVLQRPDGAGYTQVKVSKVAQSVLAHHLDTPWNGEAEGVWLAVAPDGDGILELFRNSDWEGRPGARNPYVQALERIDGAHRAPRAMRIGGRTCRPILVPLSCCVDIPSQQEANALAAHA